MARRHPVIAAAWPSVVGMCGGAMLAVGSILISAPAVAQITPSHVYQVVDTINAELAAMHEANASTPKVDEGAPALTPRNPRHVIQKAREVLQKIEVLRSLNGLPENPVPPFPVAELTAGNVKALVDVAYKELVELRPVFKVTKVVPQAPLPTDKTPTDNYAHLQKASDALDGLGIPKTVPNDVFRLALMIADDLEKVRAARGKTGPVEAATGATGKKPLDVYNRTFDILEQLKAKVESDPALKIPAGVILPNRRSGAVTPTQALDLENNLLAELGSIKFVVGATSPTVMPPPPQGKTPSDTYDVLTRALALAQSL